MLLVLEWVLLLLLLLEGQAAVCSSCYLISHLHWGCA
jgi:hypothetical protein